ncbi:MAG TPA: response regulator transcription factor [Rubrobacter sp.]|nr:response regulator transcription factor [Rubrobacter sp.]
MDPLRVLIADDHPLFRAGLRAMLASVPDTELVGEATTGEEAVSLAADFQPDLVVMDVQMPETDGIEATRKITRYSPHINVLVVTMFEDDGTVFQAMRAGAKGYVLKGANYAETLRAIRAVGHGEAIFSPRVAVRLVGFFSSIHPTTPPQAFPELSEREREILDLIARGHKNPEIAKRLYLSPKTVRNHVSTILHKLQVADRAQAILRAREAGLG